MDASAPLQGRHAGQHEAPKETFGLRAVEADERDSRLTREKRRKIVWYDGGVADRRVEASASLRRRADVLERDSVIDQATETFGVWQIGRRPEQRSHDRPERVARLGVVLAALQGQLARQRSEDEDGGGRSGDGRED